MKRFFCTICGKLKRVRKYPHNIVRVNAEQPEERIGTCNKHFAEVDHDAYHGPAPKMRKKVGA